MPVYSSTGKLVETTWMLFARCLVSTKQNRAVASLSSSVKLVNVMWYSMGCWTTFKPSQRPSRTAIPTRQTRPSPLTSSHRTVAYPTSCCDSSMPTSWRRCPSPVHWCATGSDCIDARMWSTKLEMKDLRLNAGKILENFGWFRRGSEYLSPRLSIVVPDNLCTWQSLWILNVEQQAGDVQHQRLFSKPFARPTMLNYIEPAKDQ